MHFAHERIYLRTATLLRAAVALSANRASVVVDRRVSQLSENCRSRSLNAGASSQNAAWPTPFIR
jgi:hypothetical protein